MTSLQNLKQAGLGASFAGAAGNLGQATQMHATPAPVSPAATTTQAPKPTQPAAGGAPGWKNPIGQLRHVTQHAHDALNGMTDQQKKFYYENFSQWNIGATPASYARYLHGRGELPATYVMPQQ